ncbi:hypothetical protein [Bacillus sp. Marseille-P3800]|uniref:hypothetical protein n=1 Tax=Bacillus sp. Marseille-P3800 TaxID=2014782 RepID=UPI000C067F0F|nr:hypothetical protein [Bacillus sp. Marseille-P3800]
MLRNIAIGAITILFLTGFFFIDRNNANPYKETDEAIDDQTIGEIRRHHLAATFVANHDDASKLSQHVSVDLTDEELNQFLSVRTTIDPAIVTANEQAITLSWSNTLVEYKKVENLWKITTVTEVDEQ